MSMEKQDDADLSYKQAGELENQDSPESPTPTSSDEQFNPSEVNWFGIKAFGGKKSTIAKKLLGLGIESRGILPVPVELRTDRQFYKIFFIWFAFNFNILSISAGTAGPVVFGLGLRDSCLVILFFNLICCLPVSYLPAWGPKLGLRQMCQSRYSFGYYGAMIPGVLNLVTMAGFMILNCILGGQTLSSVSDGQLSWTVGIVIIAIVSLLIAFCGYKIIHWYERLAWFPVLIVCLVALGLGGKNLSNPPPLAPATAASVLSFASTIAGFVLTYAGLASDFTTYMDPDVSSWRIFLYSYAGFILTLVPLQCLGAALAVAAPGIPSWSDAFSVSLGNLFSVILSPVGGFGKFLTVLLSLSVSANIAPTMYSFGMSFQITIPYFVRIPRYFFSLLATAIIIPLSIVGAHRFYDTLTNFLALIGYYASNFIAVVIVEHLVFRLPPGSGILFNRAKGSASFAAYDIPSWDTPNSLAPGIAAVSASVLSYGLVVPCMDQVWFVGPIARTTGDIGFEMAFALTAMLYIPLRSLERRYFGR